MEGSYEPSVQEKTWEKPQERTVASLSFLKGALLFKVRRVNSPNTIDEYPGIEVSRCYSGNDVFA